MCRAERYPQIPARHGVQIRGCTSVHCTTRQRRTVPCDHESRGRPTHLWIFADLTCHEAIPGKIAVREVEFYLQASRRHCIKSTAQLYSAPLLGKGVGSLQACSERQAVALPQEQTGWKYNSKNSIPGVLLSSWRLQTPPSWYFPWHRLLWPYCASPLTATMNSCRCPAEAL